MIENDLQYDITREQVEKFEEAPAVVRSKHAVVEDSDERWKLDTFEDAIRSQSADLVADIAEYERVQSSTGVPE